LTDHRDDPDGPAAGGDNVMRLDNPEAQQANARSPEQPDSRYLTVVQVRWKSLLR